MHFKQAPFLQIPTIKVDIHKRTSPEGCIYLKSAIPLESHPHRMTERLLEWAETRPNATFLGQRDSRGAWREISYAQTLDEVERIGQWLLEQPVTPAHPVAIIAENSIEHALMALAALHVGIPYCTITPAYATKSTDYTKLRYAINLLDPGVLVISDGQRFEKALSQIKHRAGVVYFRNAPAHIPNAAHFSAIKETTPTAQVRSAFDRIQPDTIAKVLFTSGSTGLPKGVINTHVNITSNWQQIVQVFPFMKDGFELVDWLPWNHTFGGNHNLGLTLYNGGSLYIDEGKPTPEGIHRTVENLRDRNPTIYFNVPKGFEELIPYLRQDEKLRSQFFSKLKLLFYAGAGMAQHIWDALEELSFMTLGKRLLIATGLGCTEASPSALFNTHFGSFAGMLGVPVPGLELKLMPTAGKLEARYKGDNIMPGYWRNPEATKEAFDEEGFYKTGDALRFVNPEDPNEGMVFNGRIAEDFKLDTGTWVHVGHLRIRLIEAGKGFIKDVVITGHDQSYIGAIVFPETDYLRSKLGLDNCSVDHISTHPDVLRELKEVLLTFASQSTGRSTFVRKAVIAPFLLDPARGEITDKGTINQRAVLEHRSEFVASIYSDDYHRVVVDIDS